MAFEHIVAGPVTVSYNSVGLGFTQDGAIITYTPFFGDIHSDDWGGAGGAPADTQLLGTIASVALDMTKYDVAAVQALAAFSKGGGADGDIPAFGTLIRQEGKFATLVLAGSIKTYTFLTAFPREPQSLNAGTKFSTFTLHFEMWLNSPESRSLQSIT